MPASFFRSPGRRSLFTVRRYWRRNAAFIITMDAKPNFIPTFVLFAPLW
jgi:hypothetical protein